MCTKGAQTAPLHRGWRPGPVLRWLWISQTGAGIVLLQCLFLLCSEGLLAQLKCYVFTLQSHKTQTAFWSNDGFIWLWKPRNLQTRTALDLRRCKSNPWTKDTHPLCLGPLGFERQSFIKKEGWTGRLDRQSAVDPGGQSEHGPSGPKGSCSNLPLDGVGRARSQEWWTISFPH